MSVEELLGGRIKGSVTGEPYKGWMRLASVNSGFFRPRKEMGVSFSMLVDRAYLGMMVECAAGRELNFTIHHCTRTSTARGTRSRWEPFMIQVYSTCHLNALTTETAGDGSRVLHGEFDYCKAVFTYYERGPDGQLKAGGRKRTVTVHDRKKGR